MSQCLLRACLDNHSTPFRQSLSWGGRLCAPSFLYVLQNLFFYARQSTEQPCFAAASLSFSSAAWALFKGYQWAISVLQPVLFGFIVWLWQPLLWSLLLGLQCTTVQEVCLRFRKPFCVVMTGKCDVCSKGCFWCSLLISLVLIWLKKKLSPIVWYEE